MIEELLSRLLVEMGQPAARDDARVCAGTLLSREQYLYDVEELGYLDGRLTPASTMTPQDIAVWTQAIPDRQAELDAQSPVGPANGAPAPADLAETGEPIPPR